MNITLPKIIHGIATLLFALSLAFLLYICFGLVCYYLQDNGIAQFSFLEIRQAPERVFLKIPIVNFGVEFPPRSVEVLFMIIFFSFYAVYFFLMKKFFGIFSNANSFIKKNLTYANLFIIANLVPVVFWAAFAIYYWATSTANINYFDEDFAVLLVHLFVILLVVLYKDILKKGIELQEQTELTI